MFEIIKYSESKHDEWNDFVENAKNSTFLFKREYMEYHSDRFIDMSLMVYYKEKLFALLPANIVDDTLYSHQGLTYGGLILNKKATVNEVMLSFQYINTYLKSIGIKKVCYKTIPHIYHQIPSEEDLYVLYRLDAKLIARNISSTIYQLDKIRFSELRRRCVKKAKQNHVDICSSDDFASFWEILTSNLATKYSTKPVHELNEIELLHSRFPENIKLYMAYQDGNPIAGIVVYLTKNVCHVQYISSSHEGKMCGALDLLFDKLINEIYLDYPYFDFGQSTEQKGMYLNENLIFQKEGFGGRGVVYDMYEYEIM